MSPKDSITPIEFTLPPDTSPEHVLAFRVVAANLILFLIEKTNSEEEAITYLQTMSAGPEKDRDMLVYEYANSFENAIIQSLANAER